MVAFTPRQLLPITLFSLLLALPQSLQAKVASYWMDLPPLRTPRQEVGVAVLGHQVYVIGGILENRTATGIVERFDPKTKRWEALPPLPGNTRLHHVGTASALGRVFVVGGLNSSFRGVRSLFVFDPTKGVWTRKADLPRARGAMGVAAIDGKIYAAGGQNGSTSFDHFAVYHVGEDRWEILSPMPTARNHLAATTVDGVFYAVGGRAGGLKRELEAYDPATKRWATLAPMPTARGGIAAATAFGWIFVFGGEGNGNDPNGIFPQVEGYDPCRNRWHEDEPMSHPRHGIGAVTVEDAIHIPGGSPVQGFGVTDVHDVFFPGTLGPPPYFFKRGDANRDGTVDISDAISTLFFLFVIRAELICPDAADVNDDGTVNVADPISLLGYLFRDSRPPPEPGPDFPGFDPTDDDLGPCFGKVPVSCVNPF